jgi:hypothetical protein
MIWISKLPFALSLSKGMFMVRQAHHERNMEIILSNYLVVEVSESDAFIEGEEHPPNTPLPPSRGESFKGGIHVTARVHNSPLEGGQGGVAHLSTNMPEEPKKIKTSRNFASLAAE